MYLELKMTVLQEFLCNGRSWNLRVKPYKGVKYTSVAVTVRSNCEGNFGKTKYKKKTTSYFILIYLYHF